MYSSQTEDDTQIQILHKKYIKPKFYKESKTESEPETDSFERSIVVLKKTRSREVLESSSVCSESSSSRGYTDYSETDDYSVGNSFCTKLKMAEGKPADIKEKDHSEGDSDNKECADKGNNDGQISNKNVVKTENIEEKGRYVSNCCLFEGMFQKSTKNEKLSKDLVFVSNIKPWSVKKTSSYSRELYKTGRLNGVNRSRYRNKAYRKVLKKISKTEQQVPREFLKEFDSEKEIKEIDYTKYYESEIKRKNKKVQKGHGEEAKIFNLNLLKTDTKQQTSKKQLLCWNIDGNDLEDKLTKSLQTSRETSKKTLKERRMGFKLGFFRKCILLSRHREKKTPNKIIEITEDCFKGVMVSKDKDSVNENLPKLRMDEIINLNNNLSPLNDGEKNSEDVEAAGESCFFRTYQVYSLFKYSQPIESDLEKFNDEARSEVEMRVVQYETRNVKTQMNSKCKEKSNLTSTKQITLPVGACPKPLSSLESIDSFETEEDCEANHMSDVRVTRCIKSFDCGCPSPSISTLTPTLERSSSLFVNSLLDKPIQEETCKDKKLNWSSVENELQQFRKTKYTFCTGLKCIHDCLSNKTLGGGRLFLYSELRPVDHDVFLLEIDRDLIDADMDSLKLEEEMKPFDVRCSTSEVEGFKAIPDPDIVPFSSNVENNEVNSGSSNCSSLSGIE